MACFLCCSPSREIDSIGIWLFLHLHSSRINFRLPLIGLTSLSMSDFTTEAFTLLGIGLGVIGFRTYARFHVAGLKGLEADDYLMMLAAVGRFRSPSEYDLLTCLGRVLGRDGPRLFSRSILAWPRQQWYDGCRTTSIESQK